MVKSNDKMVNSMVFRRAGPVVGTVALALALAACGGGGGSSSSSGTSTGSTNTGTSNASGTSTSTGSAAITTATATGTAGSATTVDLSLAVSSASGSAVGNATLTVTKADGSTLTFTNTDNGTYTGSLSAADLAATSTVVITVSAEGFQTTTVNLKASDLTAGNSYSASTTLTKTGSLSLGTITLNPSSVYLGDGVPTDKKATNQFSASTPLGLTYTADLGAMTSEMEGYANLVVTAQIRGVDGQSCAGDLVTVFQSTSATGTRVNMASPVRISTSDVATADPVNYVITVPATAFKAAAGHLYAEFSVKGQLCAGGLEYDDLEVAAVNAGFSAN